MNTEQTKPKNAYALVGKIFLITIGSLLAIIGALVLLLFVYENEIKKAILGELNKNLQAEVKINPENINLTIIKSFPDCAMQFNDVLILEALPVKNRDTLLFAGQLNLLFNVMDIWHKKYDIQKIKLKDAYANLQILKNGKNNFTFWKENPNASNNDSLNFNLNRVNLENCLLKFKNKAALFKTEVLIRQMQLKGNFSAEAYKLESTANIDLLLIAQNKNTVLQNKNLTFDIDLEVKQNNYLINKAKLNLNKLALDLSGNCVYRDSLQALNLAFNAPDLDIQSLLSLLPESHKGRIQDYQSQGNFYTTGQLQYHSKENYSLAASFGIKNGEVIYQKNDIKADQILIDGEFLMSQKTTELNLRNMSLNLLNDKLSAQLKIKDFSNPEILCKINAHANLLNLQKFWPIDTITAIEGQMDLAIEANGLWEDFQKQNLKGNSHIAIDAAAQSIKAKLKDDDKLYEVGSASLSVRDQDIEVYDLQLKRGSSDLKISGKLPGLMAAINHSTETFVIDGKLESDLIIMEDFLPKSNNSTANNETIIPTNIEFKLDAKIKKFVFGKFEAKNIHGDMECKHRKVFVNDVTLETSDGEVILNAFADNNKNRLDVVMQTSFSNININKLFTSFNNFGQNTLIDKNIKGVATATVDFSGTWSNRLEVDEKSIQTNCLLNVERGELIDFKPLESLSNYVSLDELKHIKFQTLQSKIEIKNRVITIPQTNIKNSALNINFWGTQTFDYDIDYHIQLLLSDYLSKKRKRNDDEFGPVENDPENKRSAFILMTGNLDNPIIKYDKKGLKQKIKADIKAEKQNIKQIFREEFGLFKRDTTKTAKQKKSEQQFELEKPGKKKANTSKEEEDDGDF